MSKCPRLHNLDCAIGSQNIPGQPHFTTAASTDYPEKFMVGHKGWARRD